MRGSEEARLIVRLTAIDRFTPAFLPVRDRILELLALRAGRNRRRRSSILCKIGIHDWEAWQVSTASISAFIRVEPGHGLRFVKRCRRRGCTAARAIKTRTLGPTEPMMTAKLRGGSDA